LVLQGRRRPRSYERAAGGRGCTGNTSFHLEQLRRQFSGWTAGAGLDYALTYNIFGRVEWRYNDYGSKVLLGIDTVFNQKVVTVGVGFRF
jgi:outer membrane immunogenic protein